MPNEIDNKILDQLVKKTLSLQTKLNAGIKDENKKRALKGEEPLPTFNLSKDQITNNIRLKYDTYQRCKNYMSENEKQKETNKLFIAKEGKTYKKDNFREKNYLNLHGAYNAYDEEEFKTFVKNTNSPQKTCDFKMKTINEHVNSNHFDAYKGARSAYNALEYLENHKKQTYIGASFTGLCNENRGSDKVGFNISNDLKKELADQEKYLRDPYRSILSQVNFNSTPLTFLFANSQDPTYEQSLAMQYGSQKLFHDSEFSEENSQIRDASWASEYITKDKLRNYASDQIKFALPAHLQPLAKVKELVANEKNKFTLDAYENRIQNPERSNALSFEEFAEYDNLKNKDNPRNTEKIWADYGRYSGPAKEKEIAGDKAYEKAKTMQMNEAAMRQTIKDEHDYENMSPIRRFFGYFRKPDRESNYAGYLRQRVGANKANFEKDGVLNEYNDKYKEFKRIKEEPARKAAQEAYEKTDEFKRNKLLSTPASKGPSVIETGDPDFDKNQVKDIQKQMKAEYDKCGFLARQLSRLIPDVLLEWAPFRWVMKHLIPFGWGTDLIDAADSRQSIQKFNRKVARGFIKNPLGRFNHDKNLTFEEKCIADYKNNYKRILKDYYEKSGGKRFGSRFVPKSWTDAGKYKLDIEINDEMLREALGNVSWSELNKMKAEVMEEFEKEHEIELEQRRKSKEEADKKKAQEDQYQKDHAEEINNEILNTLFKDENEKSNIELKEMNPEVPNNELKEDKYNEGIVVENNKQNENFIHVDPNENSNQNVANNLNLSESNLDNSNDVIQKSQNDVFLDNSNNINNINNIENSNVNNINNINNINNDSTSNVINNFEKLNDNQNENQINNPQRVPIIVSGAKDEDWSSYKYKQENKLRENILQNTLEDEDELQRTGTNL